MKRIKNELALWRVHIKMIKRGLLTGKDFIHTLTLALVLLLSSTALYAQQERNIRFAGEQFTIGELIREIEAQGETLLNVGASIDRREVVTQAVSPEFMRDVVEQVLAGSDCIFRRANVFNVLVVEGANGVIDQIFVERTTNRIMGINEVFGEEALRARVGVFDERFVERVLSGQQYTLHSSGTYTIITVFCQEGIRQLERQIVVDMATRQVVPLERFLNPQITPQFDTFLFPRDYFPRFALKTNLLYGATTSMNIGAEFFLNRFLTLDLSLGWNPFVHRDNVKFAHWMVQPTLRYWIYEPFNGHFFGLSLMYSNFNVSGIRQPYEWLGVFPRLALSGNDGYRFRGDAFSASIQYGHQWILSPRWAIEASINVGYMLLDYQVWGGGWCSERIGSERRHYFGPTNASISLIYVFR